MVEKIILDDGVIELDINGRGLLRFNPTDFNIYQRLTALLRELPVLEKKYHEEVEDADTSLNDWDRTAAALDKAGDIDREIKSRLSAVFGPENDFERILNGVNLMSYGGNGERVITNLLNALTPYIENGLKRHMRDTAAHAVAEARQSRAQRKKA